MSAKSNSKNKESTAATLKCLEELNGELILYLMKIGKC